MHLSFDMILQTGMKASEKVESINNYWAKGKLNEYFIKLISMQLHSFDVCTLHRQS